MTVVVPDVSPARVTVIAACLMALTFRGAAVIPGVRAATETKCTGEMKATSAGPMQASLGASAGCPWSVRRWLTTAPQDDAAGDQITGRGPLAGSSGQPEDSRSAAAPDDLLSTFTVVQPFWWAAELSLKLLASWVRSSTFSGELARSTLVHPLPAPPPPPDEQAAGSGLHESEIAHVVFSLSRAQRGISGATEPCARCRR